MSVKIRLAEDQDAAVLSELAGQLGYPSSAAEILARVRQFRTLTDHAVLVAEADGRVVGWLHAQVRRSLELPEHAEITGMVVDEGHRGRGIGAELVRAAEAWTRRQGLPFLKVKSNVVRERTHAFYLKLGFTVNKTQMVFKKELR